VARQRSVNGTAGDREIILSRGGERCGPPFAALVRRLPGAAGDVALDVRAATAERLVARRPLHGLDEVLLLAGRPEVRERVVAGVRRERPRHARGDQGQAQTEHEQAAPPLRTPGLATARTRCRGGPADAVAGWSG